LRRILRNDVVIVMGGQIVLLMTGVVTSTIIARALAADGYGVVNLLRNILVIALTVSPLGLDVSLLKFCGRGRDPDSFKLAIAWKLRAIARVASILAVTLVGLAVATGFIQRIYAFPAVGQAFLITFLALPFATDAALLGAVYRASGRAGRYALLVSYAQSAFRIVAVPLTVVFCPTIEAILWINTLQIILSSLLLSADLRRQEKTHARAADAQPQAEAVDAEAKRLLRESVWMCLSILAYSLMRSADVMFLGAFAPASSLGAYSALAMVAQLVAIFPMAASQSLGPNISHAHHRGEPEGVRRELDHYLSKAAPISGFIFGGIAIFGQRLDLVFGASFHFDPLVCLLLPLGQTLSAALAPMGYALSMTGRHRAETAILCLGAVILIASCLIFVPRYGAVAAAAAVAFAFLFVNGVRFALVIRSLGSIPGRLIDLAPAPAGLCLAWLAADICDSLGPRNLATNFCGCLLYALLFGVLAFSFFIDSGVRSKMVQSLVGRA